MQIKQQDLEKALKLFRAIIRAHEPRGREFVSFRQGVVDVEEGYKARVHTVARRWLASESWLETDIGTGAILERVIHSITVPGNNLLTWDDRNGEGTRSQIALDRALDEQRSAPLERLFFELYREVRNEAELFEEAIDILGRNYPLLSYLWFLKDLERFTPARPQSLQAGLGELGLHYPLASQCSWDNYVGFLEIVRRLRPMLITALEDPSIRLLDSHSFIWVIGNWPRDGRRRSTVGSSMTTSYGPIEMAAYEIANSILKTVSSANGQIVERRVKEKDCDMSRLELEAYIAELIRTQNGRCALSGLPLGLPPEIRDREMCASPDRIDSDLGYSRGNIQIVC